MFIPNREELAWAAGFFDGEGCILLHAGYMSKKGRRNYNVRVIVTQYEKSTLERFQRAIGGLGKIYGPYAHESYQWITDKFEHAQATIAMLWPFLSGPKKKQATGVLEAAKAMEGRT